MATVETILTYGFGADPGKAALANGRADLWWSKNAEADREIRQRFEASVQLAAAGKLNPWLAEPRGRLALIVLTDLFPRNIYRDSPLAFSFDAKALGWSRDGIQQGHDQLLQPIERAFFYLPLEHSERADHQERSVRMFGELVPLVAAEQTEIFEHYLNVAIPHRNHILGRSSTAEELYFLAQPGSSF